MKKYFHNKKEAMTILKEEVSSGLLNDINVKCFTHTEEYIFDALVRESQGFNFRIDYFYKEHKDDLPFHIGEQVWSMN